MNAADTVLSLMFKKLHPLLEDVAHAVAQGASVQDLEKLHLKLLRSRFSVAETLEKLLEEPLPEALAEAVEELVDNMTPAGETFQQSLILTQLCLEDGPQTFLPFVDEATLDAAPWPRRMHAFLALIQEPRHQAEQRWNGVDPDIGEGLDEEG